MNKSRILTIACTLVGITGGWLYWKFVGCTGGACPIWSNPWIASGYGGLIGFLVCGLFKNSKAVKKDKDKQAASA